MAKAASRSSKNTDLYVGTLKCSVALFGTQAKPGKEQQFDSAGPKGGKLKYEMRGAMAPDPSPADLDETTPVQADPLAGDAPDYGRGGMPNTKLDEFIADRTPAAAALANEDSSTVALEEAAAAATVGLADGEYRQVLVEEGTGEVVEPEKVRKGIRLDDGRFVDCTEQLAAITERTKLERMDIVATIDSTRVGRAQVIASYFVGVQEATDMESAARLRLLFESLRARREAAVVKFTTGSRQQLGALVPHSKSGTLVLLTLVFAEDFREAPARAKVIQKAAVTEAHVEAMGRLLGALHDTPDVLDTLRDDAIAMREELKTRALAGEMDVQVVEPLPAAEPEFDLEAALEASLAQTTGGKA